MQAYNPYYLEDHAKKFKASLSNSVRTCLKMKSKQRIGFSSVAERLPGRHRLYIQSQIVTQVIHCNEVCVSLLDWWGKEDPGA